MATVTLKHVYKVYENATKEKGKKGGEKAEIKPAVSNFCMEIKDKEFIVFVGPSGCGKSTTLRMIAGLEEITDGEIYIDDRLINNVEPKDRDIAMVFQNYALYPNMSVYDNMAFALKLRKIQDFKKDKNGEYVLDEKGEKIPIVRKPKVFLLDEPLSNLDAKLRANMRAEIIKLYEKLGTTFIYVTHDQIEAMTMGTRIVVMKDGFIQQIGAPQYLYDKPVNVFVAGFIGTPQMNFFRGRVFADGKVIFANNQQIVIPKTIFEQFDLEKIGDGLDIIMGIRPGDITVGEEYVKDVSVPAIVEVIEALGNETIIYANCDDQNDRLIENSETMITASVKLKQNPVRNQKIYLYFDTEKVHLFDAETELSLRK